MYAVFPPIIAVGDEFEFLIAEVYLNDYASVRTAHTRLGRYFDYYNTERPHQALAYNTPADVYFKEHVGQETNMIQDS